MNNQHAVASTIAYELLHPENFVRKHPELLDSFHINVEHTVSIYDDVNQQLKYFLNIHNKFLTESIAFLNECNMLNHETYQVEYCEKLVMYNHPYYQEDDFCTLLSNILKENHREKILWKICERKIDEIVTLFKTQ
jgi:hypothetical protein